MPVTINGSGSIAGLNAGGLPSSALTGAIPTSIMPAGSVIQTVTATHSTISTNETTTYTDTGLTATITPQFSSSKILILTYHSVNFSNFAGNGDTGGWSIRLLRGNTVIKNGSTNGSDHYISVPAESSYIVFNDPDFQQHFDSPNTTSAVTYKTQANQSNSEIGVNINNNQNSNVDSSMILMEVSA